MFFGKKKCRKCGEKVDDKWSFCPYCGEELKKPKSILENIDREFEKVDKMLSFKPIKGISIMISGGEGMEPKIKIKTPSYGEDETKREKVKERSIRIPKITEEPETKIERIGNRQVIKMKLPGVKMEDIEIKRLEQSIEVKAFAGDKTYFKLIPIPSNAAINRSFESEMLKIEVLKS